jgi:hypothetical protein
MDSYGGMIVTGKTEELGEKTCHSDTLSTINLTWTDHSMNSDLHSEREACN